MMEQLHVGFGRVNITPSMGTPIGGYYVVRLAEKVLDELECNAIAFAMGDKKALLVSADISGLFYEFAEPLCQHIAKETGVPADCIFITCTHTHTGPEANINRRIVPEKQEEYLHFFRLRKHGNRSRGGVDAAGGFRFRNALHPMYAAFEFEF